MKTDAVVGFVVSLLCATSVSADDASPPGAYDRLHGESSIGTSAPTRQQMVNAIKNATPTRLYATLEYGERVECFECIPGLTEKLLSSNDAEVREISAWWLRRRSFGFGPVMVKMQQVAREDTDPVRRARAASALGEFLDPHGAETLSSLARADADVTVRVAAVRALGRLNTLSVRAGLSSALHDTDPQVRLAALQQVLKVNFFDDMDSLLGLLGDSDVQVRNLAVQLSGELRLTAASDALLGILMTDDSVRVRQAAAIALGHIGGVDAGDALSDAMTVEKDSAVQDAISIARRMR